MALRKTDDTEQRVERYMALPYAIELRSSEEGWFAAIPDLPGCISQGDSAEEALDMIRDAQRAWLEVALEDGDAIPEPSTAAHSFSGRFNVRVPKELHRQLVYAAEREGVSLNQLVTATLASAVGVYRQVSPRSTGDNPPGRA